MFCDQISKSLLSFCLSLEGRGGGCNLPRAVGTLYIQQHTKAIMANVTGMECDDKLNPVTRSRVILVFSEVEKRDYNR